MKLISKLKKIVEKNCINKDGITTTLAYWSDVIFANAVFILIPLSLIAIIPAIFISVEEKTYTILAFDIFCFFMLILIGYLPGLTVAIRKVCLMVLLFLAAFVLLITLGDFGPGLMYLLSITVFTLLLFPGKKTWLPFSLTLFFCLIYAVIIHLKLFNSLAIDRISPFTWFAISSNVLLLSALFSMIVPFFFSKLETVLNEKIDLLESVNKVNIELNNTISQLNIKNSQLEQYAFVASHDLQEPLRTITSFLNKLSVKYNDQLEEKYKQYISFSISGAERMKHIIEDLENHYIAGENSESLEQVDLQELINDFLISRNQLITEKSVKLETGNLPKVKAYKLPLLQTLNCLLDNAIKFSQPDIPPKIIINCKEKVSEYQFSIQDNGIGIDSRFFNKIFVIFQRLHNRDQFGGTGIGLSIAKKNVESWGGKIWVESTPGKSSTFYFTLPKI